MVRTCYFSQNTERVILILFVLSVLSVLSVFSVFFVFFVANSHPLFSR
jgi:hypothetical protein